MRTRTSEKLTGFANGLIVEAGLADFKGAPLFTFYLLINVDDMEILVLMRVSMRQGGDNYWSC